jgi:hypothetical protein
MIDLLFRLEGVWRRSGGRTSSVRQAGDLTLVRRGEPPAVGAGRQIDRASSVLERSLP